MLKFSAARLYLYSISLIKNKEGVFPTPSSFLVLEYINLHSIYSTLVLTYNYSNLYSSIRSSSVIHTFCIEYGSKYSSSTSNYHIRLHSAFLSVGFPLNTWRFSSCLKRNQWHLLHRHIDRHSSSDSGTI